MTRLKLDYTDISTNLEGREIDFYKNLKLSIKRQVLSPLIFHQFRNYQTSVEKNVLKRGKDGGGGGDSDSSRYYLHCIFFVLKNKNKADSNVRHRVGPTK